MPTDRVPNVATPDAFVMAVVVPVKVPDEMAMVTVAPAMATPPLMSVTVTEPRELPIAVFAG